MRNTHAIALVLFAWMMIGADDCALTQVGKPAPPPPPAAKPFCQFDPPVGCRAICADVGVPAFTPQCSDISASVLEAEFEQQVSSAIQQAEAMGIPVCPADKVNMGGLTPCALGITPQPNPPESQDFA